MRAIGLCFLCVLGMLSSSVSAPALTMDLDFTGNSLPSDWTVYSTMNGGSIHNEWLETVQVDQGITIAHDLTAPMSRIFISYRGEIRDSYWGSYNEVHLVGSSQTASFVHLNRTWNEGDDNLAQMHLPGEPMLRVEYPESFPTYLHEIEFQGTTASYRIIDEATQTVVADMVRTGSTLAAHDVEQIQIRALHTTGTGQTWIDDVHVELFHAPEPGTMTLMGLGLLGLARCGRRPGS